MRGIKGRLAWLVAAAVAICASFIAVQPAGATAAEPECNGAAELCAKPFDQVVLPATHNSMSAQDLGWAIPNQLVSIPNQLNGGIRGFLIDTHYGKKGADGTVTGVSKTVGHANGDTMYLCHELCQLGASELIPEMTKIRDYLAANPREVVLFVNQDGITPDDYANAVTESGLISYVYNGSTTEWPTLSEMITTNQRVVMLSEGATGTIPWYHDAYDGALQETPYNFRPNGGTTQQGIDNLTDPTKLNESCRPNRGGETGSLFLMNHWVNGTLDNSNPIAPDPAVAQILNAKDVLVNRARACQQLRGIMPTLIAVDDFGEGDLLGAVRELNGLPPEPDPDPIPVPDPPVPPQIRLKVGAPKHVVARAGRRAVVKVRVSNVGDGPGFVKICATVPKRLAKKPRCAVVELAAGASAARAIKIQTKRNVKGSGKVAITLTTAVEILTKKATLKVKPLQKKKKHSKPGKRR